MAYWNPNAPMCVHCAVNGNHGVEICANCGEEGWRTAGHSESIYVRGYDGCLESWCSECADEYAIGCDSCGEIVHTEDTRYVEHSESTLCAQCYEDRMDSNGYYICDYHNSEWSRTVHVMEHEVRHPDTVTLGIELEVSRGCGAIGCGSMSEILVHANHLHSKRIIGFENDSSIEEGFEIITCPMTYGYWSEEVRPHFHVLLDSLREEGFLSHNGGSCGLHIHIGKPSLGTTETEQDANLTKILFVFERYWKDMVTFSRRREGQISQWAGRYGTDSVHDLDAIVKNKHNQARYSAINITPHSTVEFRLYRGTLKPVSFDAAIDFTVGLVEGCRKATVREVMESTSVLDLIHEDYMTDPLKEYLTIRGLKENSVSIADPDNSEESHD